MDMFGQAQKAFLRAHDIHRNDAQLQYNLGLCYFKQKQYSKAIEHLKFCTEIEPNHPYAFNNLAYIYNLHQYYQETLNLCNFAKQKLGKLYCTKLNEQRRKRGTQNKQVKMLQDVDDEFLHNVHAHWAFAHFKKGDMGKAIKKIQIGALVSPHSPDVWIIWGLILKTVGNYKLARGKFMKALEVDPGN